MCTTLNPVVPNDRSCGAVFQITAARRRDWTAKIVVLKHHADGFRIDFVLRLAAWIAVGIDAAVLQGDVAGLFGFRAAGWKISRLHEQAVARPRQGAVGDDNVIAEEKIDCSRLDTICPGSAISIGEAVRIGAAVSVHNRKTRDLNVAGLESDRRSRTRTDSHNAATRGAVRILEMRVRSHNCVLAINYRLCACAGIGYSDYADRLRRSPAGGDVNKLVVRSVMDLYRVTRSQCVPRKRIDRRVRLSGTDVINCRERG